MTFSYSKIKHGSKVKNDTDKYHTILLIWGTKIVKFMESRELPGAREKEK